MYNFILEIFHPINSNIIQILHLVFEIGAVILGLYLAFFKSYFQEKGKNIATIEDIQYITNLVEEVKIKFINESDFLRSKLSLYAQNFHTIKTMERNAIVEVNIKYSEWLHALSNFSLAYYSYDNFDELKSKYSYFEQKHLAYKVAVDNLHLFAHDMELIKIKSNLESRTYKLHGAVLSHIGNFITNCNVYNQKRSTTNYEEQIKFNEEYHSIQQPLIEKSILESKSLYLELYNIQINFILLLNNKIYSLIEKNE